MLFHAFSVFLCVCVCVPVFLYRFYESGMEERTKSGQICNVTCAVLVSGHGVKIVHHAPSLEIANCFEMKPLNIVMLPFGGITD